MKVDFSLMLGSLSFKYAHILLSGRDFWELLHFKKFISFYLFYSIFLNPDSFKYFYLTLIILLTINHMFVVKWLYIYSLRVNCLEEIFFKSQSEFVCTQLNIAIVCSQLNGFKFCNVTLTILFNFSHSFAHLNCFKHCVTWHKYLSQNGSLFFAHVKSGQSGTWSLTK